MKMFSQKWVKKKLVKEGQLREIKRKGGKGVLENDKEWVCNSWWKGGRKKKKTRKEMGWQKK
jgi:general stress protein YciG